EVVTTRATGRASNMLPDTAILIADTMGSYQDVDSHHRLHNGFTFSDSQLYAVGAGQVDQAGELLAGMDKALKQIPTQDRTFGMVLRTIAMVCYGYKRDKFTVHEFPKLRLPPEEMNPATVT